MNRRRMLLVAAVGAPLLLVLLAVAALPLLIDSDYFRGRVSAIVKSHTGRDLHIGGEVRLRLLPSTRLVVTDMRLANPPGLSGQPFAAVAELAIELELVPLLQGRMEATRLALRGLTLNLERDRNGRGNWEGLVRDDGAGASQRGTTDGLRAAAAIGAMELRDATLTWRNPETGAVSSVADIDLELASLHPEKGIDDIRLRVTLPAGASDGEPATIEARGHVELTAAGTGLLVPELTATVANLAITGVRLDGTLVTRLGADFARQHLTVDDLRLSTEVSVGEDAHATLMVSAALDVDLSRQRLAAAAVTVKIPAYSVAGIGGELDLSGVLDGDLATGAYALTGVQGHGSVGDEDDAGQRMPLRFSADLELSAAERSLAAKNLQLTVAEMHAAAGLELRAVRAPAGIAGSFDVTVHGQPLNGSFTVNETVTGHDLQLALDADFDAGGGRLPLSGQGAIVVSAGIDRAAAEQSYRIGDLQLDARLTDPGLVDGRLTVGVRADVDVDLNTETVGSDNLQVMVDNSRIAGSVQVRRFDAPAVRFDLEADAIDADRLLRPVTAAAGGPPDATPVSATIDAIRDLDLNGELRVGKLTLEGVELENVRLQSRSSSKDG